MRRDDPTRNPELSGYSFWPMGEADRVDYERLVSRLLPDIGIGHSRPLHGIKAIDPDGSVCAAIRTTARRFDANVILFRGGLGRIRIPSGKEHRRRAPVSAGFGGSEGMPLGCRQLQTRNARILSGSWLHRRRSGETSAPSGFRAGFPGFGLFVLVRASASSLSRKSISSPTLIEPSGR